MQVGRGQHRVGRVVGSTVGTTRRRIRTISITPKLLVVVVIARVVVVIICCVGKSGGGQGTGECIAHLDILVGRLVACIIELDDILVRPLMLLLMFMLLVVVVVVSIVRALVVDIVLELESSATPARALRFRARRASYGRGHRGRGRRDCCVNCGRIVSIRCHGVVGGDLLFQVLARILLGLLARPIVIQLLQVDLAILVGEGVGALGDAGAGRRQRGQILLAVAAQLLDEILVVDHGRCEL